MTRKVYAAPFVSDPTVAVVLDAGASSAVCAVLPMYGVMT